MATNVDLLTLIKMVKVRPQIYHRQYLTDKYNNSWKAKEAAWQEISKKFGVDVLILKKKWRTLRDQFQRNYKRIQASNGTSLQVNWPYFDKLLFLKDHCRSKDVNYSSFKIENDSDSEMSQYHIETDDDAKKEIKYSFETKYDLNDESCTQMSDENECTDYFTITSPNGENDENEKDGKTKNCNSNVIDKDPEITMKKQERISIDNSSNSNSNVQLSIERNPTNSDEIDRQIIECINSIKKKTEEDADHINHFCNFIGSMIKQWPENRQCEAMNYLTSYVLEKHVLYKQDIQ